MKNMKKKIVGFGGLLALLCCSVGYAATGGTLSGTIKGSDGAPFRAAFVRVRNVNTKMSMMVLSDKDGQYFTDKLPAGTYEVWATAIGYKGDPARRLDIKVEDGKNQVVGFTMQKSIVEWSSMTKYQAGTLLPDAKGKGQFMQECFNCHAFSTISAMGRHDYEGWIRAIDVMRLLKVATIKPEVADNAANYLAAVFGPDSTTPASPAQLPAYQKIKMEGDYFSDASLRIAYVDYELTGDPRDRPGVSKADKDGNMWFEDRGGASRLNPNTAEVKTWRLPEPYNNSAIHEILPVADGSVWLTLEGESGLARLDPATGKYDTYVDQDAVGKYNMAPPAQKEPNDPFPNLPVPAGGQNGHARSHTSAMDLQGNMWVTGRPLKKYDVETKKWTYFSAEVPDTYGIAVDQKGNVWATEFNSKDHQDIVMVDPKTDKVTHYQPAPGVAPRRIKVDSKGMIWFADYFGGNAVEFDPNTKQFKYFKMPGAMPTPYGFAVDHNDNVWYASMYHENMTRLDPKSGKFTEYPSPYVEKGTRDMFEDAQGRMWYGAQPYMKVGYLHLRTATDKPIALLNR